MMDEDGSLKPAGWSSVGCEDRVGGGRRGHAAGKVAKSKHFSMLFTGSSPQQTNNCSSFGFVGVFVGLRVLLPFVSCEVLFDLIFRSGGS